MPVTKLLAPPSNAHYERTGQLNEEQKEKFTALLKYFSDPCYKIPGIEEGLLKENEKFWLSSECLHRFLRATSWDLQKAIARLDDTLKWRREFGIDDLKAEYLEPEAVTGKEIIFGYDPKGRPGFYMFPSRQNTSEQTRQIQFNFWLLERCTELMDPGVENICLLINFADRAKNPSFGTSRKVLNILQSHYPERLGLAVVINIPYVINLFLNLIMPFVDPVTRQKIRLNPHVVDEEIIAADQVFKEWGGSVEFEYNHDVYWPELLKLAESRRQKWLEHWRALGGVVGICEWDYKQGSIEKREKTT